MERFVFPKPFENKLQVSYFKETLEKSFLFVDLSVSNDQVIYKLFRGVDSQKAKIILVNTFYTAEKMTVHTIFEKKADVVYHSDTFKKLMEKKEVNEIGEGIYVFQGQFLRLMKFFDSLITTFAEEQNGIEQYYPTRWPIELFKCINYFEEFPQNILLVSGAKKERKALETIIGKYGKSNDFDEIQLGDFLEPASTALGTSTCDPCYYIHKNGNIGKNELYYALSKCFRNEKSAFKQLDRLTEFSMREVIAAGEEDFVKEQRENFLKFIESFSEFTGLNCSLEKASDPFFTNEVPDKGALQNHLESKFELLVPLGNQHSDLAVASVNWHSDFFGRSFKIRDKSNYYMSSCCLAFGLERLVFSFLTQHGMDKSKWPEQIQKTFENLDSRGLPPPNNSLNSLNLNQNFINLPHEKVLNKNEEELKKSSHRNNLRKLLEDCLQLDSSEQEWLSSRNTFNWDSLNHIKVIASLEENYDILIDQKTHANLMDEKTILAYLERKVDR